MCLCFPPETEPDEGSQGAVGDGGHYPDAHHQRRSGRAVGAEEAHRDEFFAHHRQLLEVLGLLGVAYCLIGSEE